MMLAYSMNAFMVPSVTVRLRRNNIMTSTRPPIAIGTANTRNILDQRSQFKEPNIVLKPCGQCPHKDQTC